MITIACNITLCICFITWKWYIRWPKRWMWSIFEDKMRRNVYFWDVLAVLYAHSRPACCPDPKAYNYDCNGDDWDKICHGGTNQSPIELSDTAAIQSTSNSLAFVNYEKELEGPLIISNNGHTVSMPIVQREAPSLVGCRLQAVYKAIQLHFHWGSPNTKGSEHTINSKRFDAELHIVHKRSAYKTIKDALQKPDGFVVLGLLLNGVKKPKWESYGVNSILDNLKEIKNCNTKTEICAKLNFSSFLGDIDTSHFYTYYGSLTTPPCSEVVTWFVFAQPIDVSKERIKKFWQLYDLRGKPLINNYRKLQCLNSRDIFIRS